MRVPGPVLLSVELLLMFVAALVVGLTSLPTPPPDLFGWALRSLVACVCCVAAFQYCQLYEARSQDRLREFGVQLPKALALGVSLWVVVCFSLPALRLERLPAVRVVLALVAVVLAVRLIANRIRWGAPRRVLILGVGALARKIGDEIESAPQHGYSLLGYISDVADNKDIPLGEPPVLPDTTLGQMQFIDEIMQELRPDVIVVALTERRGRLPIWGLLSSCLTGVKVLDGTDFYERLTRKLAIESLNPSFLVFSRVFEDRSRVQAALRRAGNLVIAALGLAVSAPVLAVAAVLIKLESRGPVLFVQDRIGLGGRTFRLLKLRTMRVAQQASTASVWERNEEARVTRVGAWLRRLRIDELPQFVNILRGDMDLVGPRPEMAENVPTMIARIPYYPLRHIVRPGVTGWAQIRSGYAVSEAQVAEKIRYDLYYVKHHSLWFDFKIVAGTLRIVLAGRGGHCPATATTTSETMRATAPTPTWRQPAVSRGPVLAESLQLRRERVTERRAAAGG